MAVKMDTVTVSEADHDGITEAKVIPPTAKVLLDCTIRDVTCASRSGSGSIISSRRFIY